MVPGNRVVEREMEMEVEMEVIGRGRGSHVLLTNSHVATKRST